MICLLTSIWKLVKIKKIVVINCFCNKYICQGNVFLSGSKYLMITYWKLFVYIHTASKNLLDFLHDTMLFSFCQEAITNGLETPKSNTHFISARLVFHKKRVNWMFPFPLHKSSESKQRKKNWRLGARNRRKTFWCWGEMKCEVYLGLCFSVKTV